jgi:molybdopterin-guanine dinucleotide biosynthesis protein B
VALVKPVIFQVVGYQNSGKTTTVTMLVQALQTLALKAVTIKHHGHGGKPEVYQQKDSGKHLAAGALASLVEGDGRLILQTENSVFDLESQIKLMEYFQPDIILIEGHKQKDYPKLLLLRDQDDLSLLSKVNNIKVIMYWDEKMKRFLGEQQGQGMNYFSIHDDTAIVRIAHILKNLVHNMDEKD